MWQITRRITQQDLGSESVNSLILFTNLWRNKWESGRRILEWIASINQKSKLERYKQTNKQTQYFAAIFLFLIWPCRIHTAIPFLQHTLFAVTFPWISTVALVCFVGSFNLGDKLIPLVSGWNTKQNVIQFFKVWSACHRVTQATCITEVSTLLQKRSNGLWAIAKCQPLIFLPFATL